jgi:hypothetical protein
MSKPKPDPGTCADFPGRDNLATGDWNIADYAPPAADPLLAQGQATSGPWQIDRFALLQQGVTTVDPAQRLSIYGQLLKRTRITPGRHQ